MHVQRVALIMTLVVAGGCGGHSGPRRIVVSGVVTYQGKPIEKGEIFFSPMEGTVNPRSGADIIAGKYEVRASGGVPVGTHRVEITSFQALPLPPGKSASDYGDLGPPKEQYIPAKYNRQSELKVEVTAGGPKEFSFDLK
jgi:hypothetical protein